MQTLKDLVTGKSLLWRMVGGIHRRLCCSLIVGLWLLVLLSYVTSLGLSYSHED